MPETTMQWFVGHIIKCPTNYNDPRGIAIEAPSVEVARDRLWKLYAHGDYDRTRASLTLVVARDSDDLYGRTKHTMPAPLDPTTED
jgi:hypothetical protein